MKYLKQFGIILAFSFIGEGLHHVIPLPVPASIYGIVLLFLCLLTGVVKLEDVEHTSLFLIEIMPVMFIPAAVGLIESWPILQASWAAYVFTILVSTIVVMAASGLVTQCVIAMQKKRGDTK